MNQRAPQSAGAEGNILDSVASDCPACSTRGLKVFYEVTAVPTNSCILLETPEAARAYPRGDIRLGLCRECGFISNLDFDPVLTEYSSRYEGTQSFSETFHTFHRDMAEDLVKKHDLVGKDILEIGCGNGEFLSLLVGLGANRGIGFDPGYREGREGSVGRGQVEFRQKLFTEDDADIESDFICCKMTLEHIHRPATLLNSVRKAASHRDHTLVFFQVPDVTRVLEEVAFEDVYYEHCSYFGPASLAGLFRRFGFKVLGMERVYHDQYLTIEVSLADDASDALPESEMNLTRHLDLVSRFAVRGPGKVEEWEALMSGYRAREKKVVLWGSGSKAVSFLTTLRVEGSVEYVVDVNPYRQGHFMPATGQPILAPRYLVDRPPDVVVILNRAYTQEISSDLTRLGLSPEVVTL